MNKQLAHLLVPGRPSRLTVAVYRPGIAGQCASCALVETVQVDAAGAIGQLIELLNGLIMRELPPPRRPPATGGHDLLHFVYSDNTQRTIKVARGGYRSVSVENLPGSWSPTLPLYATIDMLLPLSLREELGNPVAYPPSEHPQHISEAEAIAIALSDASSSRPTNHPSTYARLMARSETARFDPALGANNASPHPARKVWLISIHEEARTTSSLVAPPSTMHGFSVVLDAETGMITDAGWGTAPLGKESCPLCQR